jgi:hypothetical protein
MYWLYYERVKGKVTIRSIEYRFCTFVTYLNKILCFHYPKSCRSIVRVFINCAEEGKYTNRLKTIILNSVSVEPANMDLPIELQFYLLHFLTTAQRCVARSINRSFCTELDNPAYWKNAETLSDSQWEDLVEDRWSSVDFFIQV